MSIKFGMIGKRLKEVISNFLLTMLWVLTERQVVYELIKLRRVRSKNRKREGNIYHGSNMEDHIRTTRGIEKDWFIGRLFFIEFSYGWFNKWFMVLYEKFRPIYFEFFHDDLKTVIDSCVTHGYIQVKSYNQNLFIKETREGRKLLSIWYFPKIILNNAIIKAAIISGITLITGYYLSKILGIQ